VAELSHFLQSVKLPVMPEVATALIRTLTNDDADVPMVRDIIAKDPALTATLLRMANSAIFGLSRSVTSLDKAVSVVGMTQIRARALSICLANAFTLPPSLNRLEFWRNSMACAGYAKWLAGSIGMDEQQAWLTGMMLRLGEIVIGQHSLVMIDRIEMRPCLPGERWARERDTAGFDEGQIMAEVARHWDFPDAVSQALGCASQPMDAVDFSPLGALVHLASLLADQTHPGAEALQMLPVAVVQKLQLNLEQLQDQIPDSNSLADTSLV
jgi:HD-like signal output (HDOD) protein